jgi:hypothetical protein
LAEKCPNVFIIDGGFDGGFDEEGFWLMIKKEPIANDFVVGANRVLSDLEERIAVDLRRKRVT